jgi:hypothetical protein
MRALCSDTGCLIIANNFRACETGLKSIHAGKPRFDAPTCLCAKAQVEYQLGFLTRIIIKAESQCHSDEMGITWV